MKLFQLAALALVLLAAPLTLAAEGPAEEAAADSGKIRVLLMTGQNNHDWKATTPPLAELIEASGRFELTIDEKPWEFGPDSFDGYDVVFSNWGVWPKVELDPWDGDTKTAFLDYLADGGGLVVMHAGSSLHYQWPAFQAMVGRTWIRKVTWHGRKHSFPVTMTGDHPITRGVESFEIFDELWRDMVPTGDYEVLATADTAKDKKAGPQEPMLITTKLGKGRGVNLVIGHDTRSIANEGFQQLFLRSLEWAARGEVADE